MVYAICNNYRFFLFNYLHLFSKFFNSIYYLYYYDIITISPPYIWFIKMPLKLNSITLRYLQNYFIHFNNLGWINQYCFDKLEFFCLEKGKFFFLLKLAIYRAILLFWRLRTLREQTYSNSKSFSVNYQSPSADRLPEIQMQ